MSDTKEHYRRACSLLRSKYSLPSYDEARDKHIEREIRITLHGLMTMEAKHPAILAAAEKSIRMPFLRGLSRA